MAYLAYIAAGVVGLLFSSVGIVFAMLGGLQFAFLIGGLLLLGHAGAIFFVVRMARVGKGPQAAIVLILPIFVVVGLALLFGIGGVIFTLLKPDSQAFALACKSAGAQYYKLPTSAVHSIAYYWTSKNAPPYNKFSVMLGSRVSLGYSDEPYPPSIEFVERRRSNLEGRPLNGPAGSYVRHPRTGAFYTITDLTADVLVMYDVDPEEELDKASADQGLITYEVTVTDRRTSEKLSTLRYAIDAKNMRGCGLTDDNTMNERSFVLRSIGVH